MIFPLSVVDMNQLFFSKLCETPFFLSTVNKFTITIMIVMINVKSFRKSHFFSGFQLGKINLMYWSTGKAA